MLQKPMLVSIITPCYNDVRFIEECVQSVLNQDYPLVEHIIQDGASSDGTDNILKQYAKRFPNKIKYVSELDKGQADALNKAILRSRGDILLVLNADDCILPHASSWAVKQLIENPDIAVVYGDVYIIDENSKRIEEFRAHPYDFEKLLCIELVPPAQAAFIRRTHFEQVGFYADDTLDTCPDYEMWVRIGLKFPMKYVPGFVTKYRRHSRPLDSKSMRTTERFVDSKKLVMNRVFDSPRMPLGIKKLRKRAYGGLYFWAAVTEFGLQAKTPFWGFVYLSLSAKSYRLSLLKRFSVYFILYAKRFIRKVLKVTLIGLPNRLLEKLTKVGKNLEKWQRILNECLAEKVKEKNTKNNL